MANEVQHRHTATGVSPMWFTIRKPTGQMWNTAGTPNFETLNVSNWADYDITLTETPAGSYLYVGTFPAISDNMVAGWYWVDVYSGSVAISATLVASYFGYWDGTSFLLQGADMLSVSGTLQTARDIGASVLLSAGTGTGQLDFTSGVVKSNLVQILATALTETGAGYLAAGIKKFFDVASPTSTMNLITAVTTATNLTNLPAKVLKYLQLLFRKDAAIAADNATELSEINANGGSGAGTFDNQTDAVQAIRDTEPLGTAMRGTDSAALASDMATVLTRLSSARAGYLDNLNVGGIVASQADILGITQAARVRVCPAPVMERPDSGSTAYRVWIYAYNEAHQAEDLDSNPTVTVENNAGTDRSANLGTVTKTGTGIYYVDYTIASSHAIESLVFKVAATEGAVTTNYPAASMVVDTTAVDFTAADRSKLEALNTDWTDGGRLDLLVDSIIARIGAITGSGDNTLLGFFKAALNKEAATPSDIGGTFTPSTDSLEALRDTAPMGTAMRGTDGANTTTPPTVAEIRAEVDTNSTKLALLQKLMEADYKIDKTTDPAQWKLVIYEKNTSTVLLTKNLKSVDGVAIANATTAVGQEVHAV